MKYVFVTLFCIFVHLTGINHNFSLNNNAYPQNIQVEKGRLPDFKNGINQLRTNTTNQITHIEKYKADNIVHSEFGIILSGNTISGFTINRNDDTLPSDIKLLDNLLGSKYCIGNIDETDVTPALWRSLVLEMECEEGQRVHIELLRPLWWMHKTGAYESQYIDLGSEELGVTGLAKVIKIGGCNVDSRDDKNSNIVIGTIKRSNCEVIELFFNNDLSNPVCVTAGHPFYSKSRHNWINASNLEINEELLSYYDYPVILTGINLHSKREDVYNIEVHRQHSYYASQYAVLVHNSNILDCTKVKVYRGGNDFITNVERDVKLDKNNLVKTTHGVSVNIDVNNLPKNKEPKQIISIPESLQIIQRGVRDPGHFEIVPKYPMSLEQFKELLLQIKVK